MYTQYFANSDSSRVYSVSEVWEELTLAERLTKDLPAAFKIFDDDAVVNWYCTRTHVTPHLNFSITASIDTGDYDDLKLFIEPGVSHVFKKNKMFIAAVAQDCYLVADLHQTTVSQAKRWLKFARKQANAYYSYRLRQVTSYKVQHNGALVQIAQSQPVYSHLTNSQLIHKTVATSHLHLVEPTAITTLRI